MSDGTIEWEEGFSEGYRSRDAEIERLRSELNMAVVAMREAEDKADEMFAGCQTRNAEIERLRLVVADWTSKTASPGLSILRMADENGRLRAEIEQLRGLLREVHYWPEHLKERVREALGGRP